MEVGQRSVIAIPYAGLGRVGRDHPVIGIVERETLSMDDSLRSGS